MPIPGQPQSPVLPGNMAGGPPHPGPSPVQAPGGGDGNKAAAVARVKAALDALYSALPALPHGDEDSRAVVAAIQALNKVFAGQEGKNLVPAAVQQMAMAAKGGPLQNAPAPGLANAPEPQQMAA